MRHAAPLLILFVSAMLAGCGAHQRVTAPWTEVPAFIAPDGPKLWIAYEVNKGRLEYLLIDAAPVTTDDDARMTRNRFRRDPDAPVHPLEALSENESSGFLAVRFADGTIAVSRLSARKAGVYLRRSPKKLCDLVDVEWRFTVAGSPWLIYWTQKHYAVDQPTFIEYFTSPGPLARMRL